ncbi:hypothetical protein [Rhodoplanes elegans]|nr:hypothetical protein [Rhodoplanes elegans]
MADLHKYQLGQRVRLVRTSRFSATANGPYEVTRQLPLEDSGFRYRVKSSSEQYERVVGEEELERAV